MKQRQNGSSQTIRNEKPTKMSTNDILEGGRLLREARRDAGWLTYFRLIKADKLTEKGYKDLRWEKQLGVFYMNGVDPKTILGFTQRWIANDESFKAKLTLCRIPPEKTAQMLRHCLESSKDFSATINMIKELFTEHKIARSVIFHDSVAAAELASSAPLSVLLEAQGMVLPYRASVTSLPKVAVETAHPLALFALEREIKNRIMDENPEKLTEALNEKLTPEILEWVSERFSPTLLSKLISNVTKADKLFALFSGRVDVEISKNGSVASYKPTIKEDETSSLVLSRIAEVAMENKEEILSDVLRARERSGRYWIGNHSRFESEAVTMDVLVKAVNLLGHERCLGSPALLEAVAKKYRQLNMGGFEQWQTIRDIRSLDRVISNLGSLPSYLGYENLAWLMYNSRSDEVKEQALSQISSFFGYNTSSSIIEGQQGFRFEGTQAELRKDISMKEVIDAFETRELRGEIKREELEEAIKRSSAVATIATYCGIADHAASVGVLSHRLTHKVENEGYYDLGSDYMEVWYPQSTEYHYETTYLMRHATKRGERANAERLIRELGELALPGLLKAIESDSLALTRDYTMPYSEYTVMYETHKRSGSSFQLTPAYDLAKRRGICIRLLEELKPNVSPEDREKITKAVGAAKLKEVDFDLEPVSGRFEHAHTYVTGQEVNLATG